MPSFPPLSPVQLAAKETLRQGMQVSTILTLGAEPGRGKTTVLAELSREMGGALLNISDLLAETNKRHPLALEESALDVIMTALRHNSLVIVDDFENLQSTVCYHGFYPRLRWIEAAILALVRYAAQTSKKLILSSSGIAHHSAFRVAIRKFAAQDYAVLAANCLGETSQSINFDKVFRFAPKLNAYQLTAAFRWLLQYQPHIDTENLIEYLRSQHLLSNVDLQEVQQVDLHELVGVDDVIRSLEIHIALPLENDQLANELSLRPKRGVLLYGPPGTGKTTVGRALAHRLKGNSF